MEHAIVPQNKKTEIEFKKEDLNCVKHESEVFLLQKENEALRFLLETEQNKNKSLKEQKSIIEEKHATVIEQYKNKINTLTQQVEQLTEKNNRIKAMMANANQASNQSTYNVQPVHTTQTRGQTALNEIINHHNTHQIQNNNSQIHTNQSHHINNQNVHMPSQFQNQGTYYRQQNFPLHSNQYNSHQNVNSPMSNQSSVNPNRVLYMQPHYNQMMQH